MPFFGKKQAKQPVSQSPAMRFYAITEPVVPRDVHGKQLVVVASGAIYANVVSREEAKTALSQLRVMKQEFIVEKRKLTEYQTGVTSSYRDYTRNGNTNPNDRMRFDQQISHLKSLAASIDTRLSALDLLMSKIQAMSLPSASSVAVDSALLHSGRSGAPSASTSLGDLLTLRPDQFEELCGRVLVAIGYRDVQRVGGSGDLSADLFARDPQGRTTVVQCKRYAPGSRIGTPVLQSFIGMYQVHHRADRGIFMTTSDFNPAAIELARQHGLTLIDGDDLVKFLNLGGIS